ncbi:unnamed protein product [Blepharisma stoltei]|uniref:C2H2-type domain-containing protein n=1 Tax=Blepharisma stoltei TaxID=1481888 RepID=A0AAU9IE97_9CILI|nr:unnamed protein product [Blepharisma stoltei]
MIFYYFFALISIAIACSWEDSKYVKDFLQDKLAPLMNQYKVKSYELPEDCPFKNAEQRDLFKTYEKTKKRISQATWECEICHKQFSKEEGLEKHIERTHAEDSNKSVCLGDFCYFLPCKEGYSGVISDRCEAIMDKCFDESFFIVARELCYVNYDEDWTIEFSQPINISLIVLTSMGCFVYYIILWSEFEGYQRDKKRKTKGRKND